MLGMRAVNRALSVREVSVSLWEMRASCNFLLFGAYSRWSGVIRFSLLFQVSQVAFLIADFSVYFALMCHSMSPVMKAKLYFLCVSYVFCEPGFEPGLFTHALNIITVIGISLTGFYAGSGLNSFFVLSRRNLILLSLCKRTTNINQHFCKCTSVLTFCFLGKCQQNYWI